MKNNSKLQNSVAIKVDQLSKEYKLYDKPIDRLKESLHPFGRQFHKKFYALDNISFEVERGETLGIVGKNGAGKSTLLKIITGILTPSNGTVHVNGRVSSLLELGAGFNPEYTGIENIYLQGSLAGHTEEEMNEKLDEILSFADIGEFVYQPVKIYSSGMYARLAFAVAINVDPDILIVDEVLSVGDMRFQQKCIRKMDEFGKAGKTILFVTHDTGTVNRFCDKALWLHEGKIKDYGETEQITKRYFSFMAYGQESSAETNESHNDYEYGDILNKEDDIVWEDVSNYESFGEGGAKISGVSMLNNDNQKINTVMPGENVKFLIKAVTYKEINNIGFGIMLKNPLGINIFTINNYFGKKEFDVDSNKNIIFEFDFTFPNIAVGEYTMVAAVSEGTQQNHIQHHWIHDAYNIKVSSKNEENFIGCLIVLDKKFYSLNYKIL